MTGTVRHLATYTCGPDLTKWGEPFVVSAEPPGRDCEPPASAGLCGLAAVWFVEIVGYKGTDPVPGQHPVRYACNEHLAGVLEECE